MFGKGTVVFSINEIKSFYPDQWVAITVAETDADGLASAGEVLMHNSNEQLVWSATRLGDTEELVYVFFTGSRQKLKAAA